MIFRADPGHDPAPDRSRGAPSSAPASMPASTPKPGPRRITVRVSHYWPPLGGPNCSRFVNGRCVSRMASGERWEDWAYRPWSEPGAAACPPEWPFGTRFRLAGREWVCLDRGGRIRYEGGVPWVDLLLPALPEPLKFGDVVEADLLP